MLYSGENINSICTSDKPVNVAGLLKLFLIELPDSVIPEQLYEDVIDATSKINLFSYLFDDSYFSSTVIALLLLLCCGPCEQIFCRSP
jgi:hypothetical protein